MEKKKKTKKSYVISAKKNGTSYDELKNVYLRKERKKNENFKCIMKWC